VKEILFSHQEKVFSRRPSFLFPPGYPIEWGGAAYLSLSRRPRGSAGTCFSERSVGTRYLLFFSHDGRRRRARLRRSPEAFSPPIFLPS